jgi:hypothetical protein
MLALNDDPLQTMQGVTLADTVRVERLSEDSACAATFPMTMAMRRPPAMVAKCLKKPLRVCGLVL